ncbi:major facilitator superfamily domain-containing protein [Aspergillus pseudonomiae]|uniref:Major facilitator superfamily domain-containing protein n=1 Tax=Aspergillus pseudonomiae TaxID=1506151 RepID=A0A5N7D8C8_9EURO|nr:major facilitator superfamily domain-containing protein [Aspergillus pseudonomiae]KAE8402223.1 major facilitator superfamily domain-containing protein [Aspergillus pseudonomiae]
MTPYSDEKDFPTNKLERGPANIDDDEEYTYEEQRKIVHRADRRLVVIAGLGYCISLMDRSNVSTASIAGMNEDLKMTEGYRYSLVMLIFFIPYVLCQPFVTATIRKFGPRNFLTTMVICWGGITIGMGFTKTWQHALIARVFLGVFESGYFPGVVYLLSCWYSRYDMHKRFSVFYSIGLFSQAIANILAYGLTHMDGIENLAGWRWIFIIEGVITLAIGLLAFVMLVDFPDKAHRSWRFLSERECAFVIRRVNRDRGDAEPEDFSIKNFLRHAADIRLWGYGLIFCCLMTVTYAIGYFLPLILRNGMGFGVGESQYLSAPPYVWACILMIFEGWLGDKYRLRGPILIVNALMQLVGISLMGLAKGNSVRYFGVFLVTGGVNASAPTALAYQAGNIRGQWKRAFASAMMIGMGGVGGIAGSLVFRSQDAPEYYPGIYANLVASALIIVLVLALSVYFVFANRRAHRGLMLLEGSAEFRYTL